MHDSTVEVVPPPVVAITVDVVVDVVVAPPLPDGPEPPLPDGPELPCAGTPDPGTVLASTELVQPRDPPAKPHDPVSAKSQIVVRFRGCGPVIEI